MSRPDVGARVLVRTDASTVIGTGHVVRCLTLADALAARGHAVRFACRTHPGMLAALIERRGHEVVVLPDAGAPAPCTTAGAPAHAAWLGAAVDDDATATIAAAAGWGADLVLVDHYAIDATWEQRVQEATGAAVAVIDDLADRAHACDLLLDQNWFGAATATRYATHVHAGCRTLLGPAHALLDPAYARARAAAAPRGDRIDRVLVFLGGSDPGDATRTVVEALGRSTLRDRAIDVVVGVNHPDPAGIAAHVAALPAGRVLRGLPTLAPVVATADLAVAAGGASTWERLCLGVPSIVVAIAENQEATHRALHDAGYVHYAGPVASLTSASITAAIDALADDPAARAAMAVRGRALVDGYGAARVADALGALLASRSAA